MKLFQKYFLYKKIMDSISAVKPACKDFPNMGFYVRQFYVENMKILSTYDRKTGYKTIVYMTDATHRYFTGVRARNIYAKATLQR